MVDKDHQAWPALQSDDSEEVRVMLALPPWILRSGCPPRCEIVHVRWTRSRSNLLLYSVPFRTSIPAPSRIFKSLDSRSPSGRTDVLASSPPGLMGRSRGTILQRSLNTRSSTAQSLYSMILRPVMCNFSQPS